jgi:hypothetical protein
MRFINTSTFCVVYQRGEQGDPGMTNIEVMRWIPMLRLESIGQRALLLFRRRGASPDACPSPTKKPRCLATRERPAARSESTTNRRSLEYREDCRDRRLSEYAKFLADGRRFGRQAEEAWNHPETAYRTLSPKRSARLSWLSLPVKSVNRSPDRTS